MAELKRTLNLTEVVFFASGVILGAGIYTVIGKAAGHAGNMLWASFLIAAVTAILSIFSYAELSALYPKSGGEYYYVKESIGQKLANVVGVMVAFGGIVGAATIALGFAGYLSGLLNVNTLLAALGVIGLILLINISGVKNSSGFNIIFTLIETGGLIFVIYSAAPQIGKINYLEIPPEGIVGLLSAAALSFFAFTGFEDTVKLAEETKNPETTIPKALFISGGIVTLLYLSITIAAVSAVDPNELASSESPLAAVAEKRFGHTGAIILGIIALFSTANSLLSNMLGASRVIYNMGKDSTKLKWLGKISEEKRTPIPALIVATLVAALFSLIGNIEKVAPIANFFILSTFILINVTVIYLRVKDKEKERPFKIPLNIKNIPVISVAALLMLFVMLGFTLYNMVK
jgi:basic amino acid/polyamine antiporter, APA family